MKKKIVLCFAVIIVIVIGVTLKADIFNKSMEFIPDEGIVPNEETAIKIAEAIWLPIYGDNIYTKQPFIAEYDEKSRTWYVHGSLSENTPGGVPEIKISKQDGKIIYINHGK